jgi:hypothetical protein
MATQEQRNSDLESNQQSREQDSLGLHALNVWAWEEVKKFQSARELRSRSHCVGTNHEGQAASRGWAEMLAGTPPKG